MTTIRHEGHRAGTRDDCPACASTAYEPGWYATMLSVDEQGGATVTLEADLDRERGEAPVT
jgi:hypothetical protein